MIASSSNKRDSLNRTVLLLLVFVALQLNNVDVQLTDAVWKQSVILLTTLGLYEFIIKSLYLLVNNSEVLLRLYWNRLYINGLWSYEYTREGRTYCGVWEIFQDVDGVRVVGNGLDDKFRSRTVVRSVSPLIEEHGGFFVINIRNELSHQNAEVVSKTTLLLDRPRRSLGLVMTMRGITVIYGGPSDRQVHSDVLFQRHTQANDIEDVIDKIRNASQGPTGDQNYEQN